MKRGNGEVGQRALTQRSTGWSILFPKNHDIVIAGFSRDAFPPSVEFNSSAMQAAFNSTFTHERADFRRQQSCFEIHRERKVALYSPHTAEIRSFGNRKMSSLVIVLGGPSRSVVCYPASGLSRGQGRPGWRRKRRGKNGQVARGPHRLCGSGLILRGRTFERSGWLWLLLARELSQLQFIAPTYTVSVQDRSKMNPHSVKPILT